MGCRAYLRPFSDIVSTALISSCSIMTDQTIKGRRHFCEREMSLHCSQSPSRLSGGWLEQDSCSACELV